MQVFPKKVFRSVPRNPMGIACSEGPLALSPRSSGTNIRTSLTARSHEVPGLRTFPSQAITSAWLVISEL